MSASKSKTIPKNLGYSNFRDAYKNYNFQVLQHSKQKQHKDEWAHKQLCLQHKLYPDLIQKHFTDKELSADLFKICQCGKLQKKVANEYEGVLRIQLDEALKNVNWKMKAAKFSDLEININNGEHIHLIELLKIKIGAVKRYTQPKTEKDIFATASFWRTLVLWQLSNDYILEMRLRSKSAQQKVNVNPKHTAKDVASWWYQCWGLHGIRQEKGRNLHCKQFFAIHDNTFVSSTSFLKSLKRVSIWIYKKKNYKKDVMATINGISMQRKNNNIKEEKTDIHHIIIKKIKTENENRNNRQSEDSSLSQGSSQSSSQCSSQSSSQSSSKSSQCQSRIQTQIRSQTPIPIPSINNNNNNNNNHNNNNRHYAHHHRQHSVSSSLSSSSSSSFRINNDCECNKLREDLRRARKREHQLLVKIEKLEQQNRELTANITRQNTVFMPLSNEMIFTPQNLDDDIMEPPLKKRKFNEQ